MAGMARLLLGAALLAACSAGADTAEEAARRFASAYSRGDGGAIYDLLTERERRGWELLAPSLPGGEATGLSPRERFAAAVDALLGPRRETVEFVRVEGGGDRARAWLRRGDDYMEITLVREERAWRVSYTLPPPAGR
jgi:hypothetical protein